jgi:oxygen-independent coproporphyrinogen-3 oxidase
MKAYTEALCSEITKKVNRKINTIFIGGGTPTYLSLDNFKRIKEVIDKLPKDETMEFTIECNPDSLTEEKISFFKEMGVNRLSVGLQAWQDKLLRKVGRIHSLEQFKKSFMKAREYGFNNINIDLMFGLPDQALEDVEETLKEVTALEPEHISCYSLIVEEGTPFYTLESRGQLNLPEEEEERKMYEFAVNFLKSKGYEQYEISNFAKPGLECRHNLTYWDLTEYIGCGSGAHSYLEGIRYRNEEDIEKYIEAMKKNNNAVIEDHKNTMEDNMEEFMFMGLRKIEGISKSEFRARFHKDVYEIYEAPIKKFIKNNLLKEKNDNILLTNKGIELSNQVMCEFILNK